MQCLWCHHQIVPDLNWNMLLFLNKPSCICKACATELEELYGEQCTRCSRMCDTSVCDDCRRWEHYYNHADVLTMNRSVFVYNQVIQEMVTKWKYRGDYVLGNLFRTYVDRSYRQLQRLLPKQTVAVPIPLSDERMNERGFNQAKMLADFFPLPQTELLERVHGEKQSKKTRKQRLRSKNPFHQTNMVNKAVLLVDDIYTTGTTLRHAAGLLKQNGCPDVYSWTLIRG